jgi:hypothetical protein
MAEQLCEIWNLLDKPHTETFKGDKIVIPAHGFISKWPNGSLINELEAAEFRSSYNGSDEFGNLIEKKIKINRVGDKRPLEQTGFNCNFCGKNFLSKTELDDHSKTHSENVIKEEPKVEQKRR